MNFANRLQDVSGVFVTSEMFLNIEGVSNQVLRAAAREDGKIIDADYSISSDNFEKSVKYFLKSIWIDGLNPDIVLEEMGKKGLPIKKIGKAADAIESRCRCSYYTDNLNEELKNVILEIC